MSVCLNHSENTLYRIEVNDLRSFKVKCLKPREIRKWSDVSHLCPLQIEPLKIDEASERCKVANSRSL